MNTADFALLMSSVTAIAAVVAPVISTVITIKANERLKRQELYTPKVYDAISRMTSSYSRLNRDFSIFVGTTEEIDAAEDQCIERYRAFLSSCYDAMALLQNDNVHNQILTLLNSISKQMHSVQTEQDAMFGQLMVDINASLVPLKSKTDKCKSCKKKYKDRQKEAKQVKK